MTTSRKLTSTNYSFYQGQLIGSAQRQLIQVLKNNGGGWMHIREIVNEIHGKWCISETFIAKSINALHALYKRGIIEETKKPITVKFRDGIVKHKSRLTFHWRLKS